MSSEIPDQSLQPEPRPGEPSSLPPAWAPSGPPAPPQRDSLWTRLAAFIVLVAVVAAAAGAGIGWSLARAVHSGQSAGAITPQSPIQAATPHTGSGSPDAIAAKVAPAIVDINTTLGNGSAAGTGMLISSTGEILTNNHVVAQSTRISVTVQGRSQRYSAHVVGVNISDDVAVIQIDQDVSSLPTVTIADSSSLRVGDSVVAIGNALGQGGAPHVTRGQVTALDQTITASEGGSSSETLNGMIQSDALIYEGDSGGALVNGSGQVVGMITAGQAQGFRSAASDVGYAISSNTALGEVNRIRAHEQAADLTYGQVGYLGVEVRDASSGALIVDVVGGGPAESAGITAGSVVTSLGGTHITDGASLGTAIRSHKAGDTVSVTWVNSSGTHTATVTLGGVNP